MNPGILHCTFMNITHILEKNDSPFKDYYDSKKLKTILITIPLNTVPENLSKSSEKCSLTIQNLASK